MAENILPSLYVGLSAWIIQDGNYADFSLGQQARFALEFYPYSLRPTYSRLTWAEHLAASRYRVWGQVVYSTDRSPRPTPGRMMMGMRTIFLPVPGKAIKPWSTDLNPRLIAE